MERPGQSGPFLFLTIILFSVIFPILCISGKIRRKEDNKLSEIQCERSFTYQIFRGIL